MTAEVINGREIAKDIRKNVSEEVLRLTSKFMVTPRVTTIKIGSDPSSDLYLKLRDKACAEVGIDSHQVEFNREVEEEQVVETVGNLNRDDSFHGILIQYPVPDHISQDRLMNSVTPRKDVEGLNPYNMGKTLQGDEYLVPCTPLAVLTILQHEKINVKGKDVVVINHSNIVGKPLAAMLLNRDATVSICHVFTKNLREYTSRADVLITAAGVPKLITSDYVKKDAVVIDVGIIKTREGVTGDVDFTSVKEKAAKITPVPGGVGPVTIACSLRNMIKTYKNCLEAV
jgi:methylenetetrahydrofolate dehydrogenase (NADP+)/methenyltetrahydrofolate cyclohydrolase